MLALVLLATVVPSVSAQGTVPQGRDVLGFSADRAAVQLERETAIDAAIDPSEIESWSKTMTPRPHHLGAPQTEQNANFMRDLFESWGFDAKIETYYVLFPTPRVRKLTLLEPTRYEARLQEEVLASDATSRIAVETGLPPFNAFSADGNVTAELVYVNRGVPSDYEDLAERGISVKGKIVIARYGGSWRGIKPKVAQEEGAIGCIIFNDPGDDGYAAGDTYPEGPFKHEWGVQRGSVLDLPKRPGDPLTPMRGATRDAERLDRKDADNLVKIPVLPIAWKDALPLLEALSGPVAPESWRGALPITYKMGPGPAKVNLELEFDWELTPAHNVIAKLEGSERPDQWIMRGNHHDAWVIGASDPISGMISLMAEAKAVGELAATGWRPKRTIVYAAWDGEEPALLGSTEWAEDHAEELRDKLAVYINTDGNSRGFLGVGGSHALETLVDQVASSVTDPQTGVTVGERLRARIQVSDAGAEAERLAAGGALRISALGSGSDYSPFLQHLGIAALNLGYGGEGSGGEYHTAFDSFDHYSKWKDPGFEYCATLAKTGARLTTRLADADVLPFDFTKTADTLSRYVDEVIALADKERKAVEIHNRMVEQGLFQLSADPTETFKAPPTKPDARYLNFAPLLNANDRLSAAAKSAQKRLRSLDLNTVSSDKLAAIDQLIYSSERRFIRGEGLPRRPWFRNLMYAPGYYTGYSVKTLPGIREGIEQGAWSEAQEQIELAADAFSELAELLETIDNRVDQ
jgi:N-acetylated-alpha-linked acidic dipeptidase